MVSKTQPRPPFRTNYTFVGRQGYQHDSEIDLYFLRRRYYDPEIGRFLNEDPLGYAAGANLFLYVNNDPINAIDPSGLWSWSSLWTPLVTVAETVGQVAVARIVKTADAVASGVRLVRGAVIKVGTAIQFTAESAVSGLARIGRVIVDRLSQAAFCLFSAALKAAGFNPDDFWNTISSLGGQLDALVRNGKEIIGNFLSGAKQGAESFGAKLPKYFTAGLAGWLELDENIFEQITMPDLKQVPQLVLKLLGYTWDDLLGLVQNAIGAENYAILAKVYVELAKVVDLGLYDYVQQKVTALIQKETDFLNQLQAGLPEVLQQMLTTILVKVAEKVATSLALKLISLLSPVGWLGQLVKGIYDAVLFFKNNFMDIKTLLNKLKDVYSAVIQGVDVSVIAQRVESALAGSVTPVLSALATLVGIDSIPKAIEDALKKIKRVAQKPVVALLQAIAKPLKVLFDALLNKLGLGAKQPLLDPVPLDKEGKQKLYVTKDGKVWLSTGSGQADQDVVACLTKGQASASGTQKPKISKALTKARQLSQDVKTVAADTKKTQTTESTQQTAKTTMAAMQEAMDLAGMLKDLMCVCGLTGTGSCLRLGTWVRDEEGNWRRVEESELMSEVTGFTRTDGFGPVRLPSAVVPEHYREYRLRLEEDPADVVEAALIRPAGWLECLERRGNGQVYLELKEVGVRGWAWVDAVLSCPARKGSGQGCLVTGKFKHIRGRVMELTIQGESQVLGITPSHLVWCVDRADWVAAGELRPGERLLAVDGSTPVVESLSLREQTETVYNIEVEGDHCYRVGKQGVLVHNQSTPSGSLPALTGNCSNISSFSNDNSTPSMFPSPVGYGVPEYTGGKTQGVLVAYGQQARLISGQTNPGKWLKDAGILTAQSWYHVEGHAISIMRQCCIKEATLYINQAPCASPPASCQTTVYRALLPGYVLNVVYENADHTKTGTGYFDSDGWHPT